MSKLAKIAPAWHAQVAAEYNREAAETNELDETARRRRIRQGLMLIWIKEQGKADGSIPHGQFGPWLEKWCKGTPRATAGDRITEAKSVLDLLRWQISEIRNFETSPHRLLAAKSEDLKGVEKERQAKLLKIIDQQSHFRAVTQYKQVELKDDATVPKIGRRKGEGGATREQRWNAQERDRMARLDRVEADSLSFVAYVTEYTDGLHLGELAVQRPEVFQSVREASQRLADFLKRVNQNGK